MPERPRITGRERQHPHSSCQVDNGRTWRWSKMMDSQIVQAMAATPYEVKPLCLMISYAFRSVVSAISFFSFSSRFNNSVSGTPEQVAEDQATYSLFISNISPSQLHPPQQKRKEGDKTHTLRIPMLPNNPSINTRLRHPRPPRQPPLQPHRIQQRPRPHHPPPRQPTQPLRKERQHIHRITHHEQNRILPDRLHGSNHRLQHHDILLNQTQSRLARFLLRASGDDDNVCLARGLGRAVRDFGVG
jgi:hypothetical protein